MALLAAIFVLSGQPSNSGVSNAIDCRRFYGKAHLVSVDEVPTWFRNSLAAFNTHLFERDPQAMFEAGILTVSNRQDLDSGQFSSKLYSQIISDGYYPVGDIGTTVNYFGVDIPETTASHGLGGLYSNTEYSDYVQKMAKFFLSNHLAPQSPIGKKTAYISESFWFPDQGVVPKIDSFLKSIKSWNLLVKKTTVDGIREKLSNFSDDSVRGLAEIVLRDLPEIESLGGGSRDYSEKQSFLNLIKASSATGVRTPGEPGYSQLVDLSFRHNVHFLKLTSAISNQDFQNIRSILARTLAQVHYMSRTSIKGWYGAAIEEKSEDSERVLEFICKSGVYLATSSIFRVFCR